MQLDEGMLSDMSQGEKDALLLKLLRKEESSTEKQHVDPYKWQRAYDETNLNFTTLMLWYRQACGVMVR